MDLVEKLFATTDLYKILNISADKAGDEKALKSGYLRAALKYHPDKASEDERETKTQQFQVITRIYELLKDSDLRKSYDETGEWPDKEDFVMDYSSFRTLDEQTILDFKKGYLGSDEEKDDVKRLYKEGKGDIFHVIENLFFANILDDEERVQNIIDGLIEDGEMDKLGKGVDKKVRDKKIKKAKKEAAEAEELRKEMKLDNGLEGLKNAIARNATGRNTFLDDLEKKYAGAEKNGKATASASNGRGRPRKTPVVVEENDDNDDTDEADDVEEDEVPKSKKRKSQPVKKPSSSRGRGRPKKAAPVEVDDEVEDLEDDDEDIEEDVSEDEAPKSKKKKVEAPKVTASKKKPAGSTGRGRGRPPKTKK
ncbi:dnaJ homolog subfamily C member 9 [Folsomia candida]|uniref:DnaJ subfamily C member 9 n=1 Tax=Folsomia candida TaxID=158441 RepID=A0A226DZY8_FOLCA|nr:dnaJ homolog subfamily C member 9 [Folsomia candida]OXA50568.1 DnaJ subfamily C member 9 [Folsomia candida]